MAKYRKLSRTSSQRKALLRGQVTALLNNGKIVTTEAKAKEVRKIAEGIIALAVKEKDNYEEVTVKAKVARKDKDGKRVKEVEHIEYADEEVYIPPDTTAMIFWLKNRKQEKWKNDPQLLELRKEELKIKKEKLESDW